MFNIHFKKSLMFNVRSKKGLMSFNFITWIPRILFLVIMLIACVLLIRLFLSSKMDSYDARAEILVSNFLYSKGGIGFYDVVTDRQYPEIINLDQLSSSKLDRSFYSPNNKFISAKIAVYSSDGEILKTVYFNREWWDNWEPLMKRSGFGGVHLYQRKVPIIYFSSTESKHTGEVLFEVAQLK